MKKKEIEFKNREVRGNEMFSRKLTEGRTLHP
jgi:hypothetical protein